MKAEVLLSAKWFLEGLLGDPPQLVRIPLAVWPFRVGRKSELACPIDSQSVSKEHAEIFHQHGKIWIRDLGSRNGTFVNGHRIEDDTPLRPGDVLHFSNIEFRLGCQRGGDAGQTMQVDKSQWIRSLSQFEKLFEPGGAIPYYQPIVQFGSEETHGYEILARSEIEGLNNPKNMFETARGLNMEARLSTLFRQRGVEVGQRLPSDANLFMNTHPAELGSSDLLESLKLLRETAPTQPLTLEIHEGAITDLKTMRWLRGELADLNIQLAYDDFGAGQARLVDLIEVPPDYLKFDICLVRNLQQATDAKRQSLDSLVRMAHDLGVAVLAEGIECQDEADACAALGFDYAQGYHFGRPAEVHHFALAAR